MPPLPDIRSPDPYVFPAGILWLANVVVLVEHTFWNALFTALMDSYVSFWELPICMCSHNNRCTKCIFTIVLMICCTECMRCGCKRMEFLAQLCFALITRVKRCNCKLSPEVSKLHTNRSITGFTLTTADRLASDRVCSASLIAIDAHIICFVSRQSQSQNRSFVAERNCCVLHCTERLGHVCSVNLIGARIVNSGLFNIAQHVP